MIRRLAARLLASLAVTKPGWPPYAFHDQHGRAHYAYKDYDALPRPRRLEVDHIMLLIDAGRPQKASTEIGNAIKAQAMKAAESRTAKEKGEALAAIFKLSDELLVRSTELIPEELAIALAAATCVREDEQDHVVIDRDIHLNKIETFKAAGRAGRPFFTPIQSALLGAAYTTAEAWQQRLTNWAMEEARYRAVMSIVTSGNKAA
jgi:hypothetical protein